VRGGGYERLDVLTATRGPPAPHPHWEDASSTPEQCSLFGYLLLIHEYTFSMLIYEYTFSIRIKTQKFLKSLPYTGSKIEDVKFNDDMYTFSIY